jgi:hypothetical protein
MMAAFENTVTITRPVEEVFAYLADAENLPQWNYAIEQTRKISPGPVGVGTLYRQTRTLPGRSQEDFEIVVFEPPGQLALDGTFGPFKARASYLLEPTSGTCDPRQPRCGCSGRWRSRRSGQRWLRTSAL